MHRITPLRESAFWGLACLLLAGCANPHRSYEKAKIVNTEQAFAAFLAEYPNSSEAPDAKANLSKLAYDRAKSAGTEQALAAFAQRFPDSEQGAQALRDIETIKVGKLIAQFSVGAIKDLFVPRSELDCRVTYEPQRVGFDLQNCPLHPKHAVLWLKSVKGIGFKCRTSTGSAYRDLTDSLIERDISAGFILSRFGPIRVCDSSGYLGHDSVGMDFYMLAETRDGLRKTLNVN